MEYTCFVGCFVCNILVCSKSMGNVVCQHDSVGIVNCYCCSGICFCWFFVFDAVVTIEMIRYNIVEYYLML